MNTFKYHILGALVFLWVIFSWFLAYAAWTTLTADVPSQNNGDTINSTTWNNIVTKLNQTIDNVNYLNTNSWIPTGAVMAFNGTTCPTGWTLADGSGDEKNTSWANTTLDLRGEFIRWLDNGRWVDSPRTLGTSQNESIKQIDVINSLWNKFWTQNWTQTSWHWASSWTPWMINNVDKFYIWTWTETRPRNVALLYCVKN